MKKFTLLFMSMFLVLGTSMAQDDKADPAAFELLTVSPADGAMVTTVYNIRLEFSKDVVVTLPEGGIDVVNSETKEVVKITRVYEDEWTPKTNAMLMFEQKIVPGKDGKEELQDQYIETPGAYTYTIPAGCIKSVDGEEFAERTFTFTIVGTFSYASYSPVTTDMLEKIVLTFEKEITEVKLPNSGLSIVDYYWTPVANVVNAVVSDDKKTVTLELDKAITEEGQYALDLYQGVFVSADGISQYSTLMFKVEDSKPSFSLNYEDGSKVQEIGNLEITFKNIAEFDWAEDAGVDLYTPTKDPIKGKTSKSEDGTRLIVSFEGDLTEEGEYVYFIPAGSFTMDGVLNEDIQISVKLERLVIEPLKVETVLPEESTVNEICKIVVKFNQPIQLSMDENWQQISREIKLTCDDGKEYILTNDPGFGTNAANELVYLANAEWVDNAYKSTPITVAGVYTLNLADIVVDHAAEEGIDEWGYPATIWHAKNQSCAGSVSWTIGGEGTGIKAVGAEDGGQVIYDLLGRCVEKIVGAGIYIVDGKKVIVK